MDFSAASPRSSPPALPGACCARAAASRSWIPGVSSRGQHGFSCSASEQPQEEAHAKSSFQKAGSVRSRDLEVIALTS